MDEQPTTHNELSGNVGRNVVQAGAIQGDVVFNSSSQSPTPGPVERVAARVEARMRAEDAADVAAAHARSMRRRKVLRRKRVFFWLYLPCLAGGGGWLALGPRLEPEPSIVLGGAWFVITMLLFLGYAGAKYEIHYGRPYLW
ncbi:hypothetical protein ACIRJS_23150 [Streptomyces sp. NPDC102340]|uniref:hypothetical protein n=1 Tax=unclassified Streptomyces TaxID=2593676 RepID=UPI0037F40094